MKNKIRVINVVGARPNFMKIAPIIEEMRRYNNRFKQILLHTGQHYDGTMSDAFFADLRIPKPDIWLGVGATDSSIQSTEIMRGFEKVCRKEKPDLVLVVGDVNSTLACGIIAAKLSIPLAHVEAGLRSFDMTMPEETNRIITDSLSDYLFTTCEDANKNLLNEGMCKDNIYFVGNVMIDTLLRFRRLAAKSQILQRLAIHKRRYAALTLHRPSNVDEVSDLKKILKAVSEIAKHMPVVFPIHPRTKKQIKKFGIREALHQNIIITDPLGYIDFLNLESNAYLVLTDSGGIQEETTILGVPCLTLRENTERPITVKEGTNTIVGTEPAKIVKAFKEIKSRPATARGRKPRLWDGKAAQRIVEILKAKI